MNLPGRLVVISGPSGAGKSTVVSQLIESCPLPLKLSISATTRPIRADDRPGENYIFLTDDQFQAKIDEEAFLECVEVFGRGHWYGTLKEQVSTGLQQGNWIILEIDVEGFHKVRKLHPDAVSVFIHPGSLDELERRLRGRSTDDEQTIARRLEVARGELEASSAYEHIVINNSIEQTVEEICQLLLKTSESAAGNPTHAPE